MMIRRTADVYRNIKASLLFGRHYSKMNVYSKMI